VDPNAENFTPDTSTTHEDTSVLDPLPDTRPQVGGANPLGPQGPQGPVSPLGNPNPSPYDPGRSLRVHPKDPEPLPPAPSQTRTPPIRVPPADYFNERMPGTNGGSQGTNYGDRTRQNQAF
jgi:hypothetical protein